MREFLWNQVAPFFGWGIFLIAGVNNVRHYGTRWEIGSLGMPRSIVAPDGQHYADGTLIDPISMQLINSGCEELVFLGLVAFMVICGAMAIRIQWATEKKREELYRLQDELRRLTKRSR